MDSRHKELVMRMCGHGVNMFFWNTDTNLEPLSLTQINFNPSIDR